MCVLSSCSVARRYCGLLKACKAQTGIETGCGLSTESVQYPRQSDYLARQPSWGEPGNPLLPFLDLLLMSAHYASLRYMMHLLFAALDCLLWSPRS